MSELEVVFFVSLFDFFLEKFSIEVDFLFLGLVFMFEKIL